VIRFCRVLLGLAAVLAAPSSAGVVPTAGSTPAVPGATAVPGTTAAPGTAAAPDAAAARAALEEGSRRLEAKQYTAAVAAFKQADDLSGGHCGPCLLGLARSLEGLERYDLAIGVLRDATTALGDDAASVTANVELGELLLLRQGDLDEAERVFSRAAQGGTGRPERAAALSGVAVVRLRQKRYVEAVATSREVLGESPAPSEPVRRQARLALCLARDAGNLPAPATAPDTFRLGSDVEKPRKLYAPAPRYTLAARKAGLKGVVILESIIDNEGCVNSLHVLKGLREDMDKSALETVKGWVFDPAMRGGKPVRVYYTLTITFSLQAQPGS
jgi:TonB family protein